MITYRNRLPHPFAGMTRIRFKGYDLRLVGATPSASCLLSSLKPPASTLSRRNHHLPGPFALTKKEGAVIEVVSRGFEAKDLEIGPPFYISQGVKDVVVFDPATLLVLHVRKEKTERKLSLREILLECGRRVVP